MKIIGRVLIITLVFAFVAGLLVTVVNASGSNAPGFDGAPQFRPQGNDNGFRPEGNRDGPDGDRGFGGLRWISGVVKNIFVIAFLVTVIVWSKNIARKNRKKGIARSSAESE